MTIPLKSEAGAKQDYIMFDVSLSINKKSKDYKTYGSSETLASYENLIKGCYHGYRFRTYGG